MPTIARLIRALAEYERLAHEVVARRGPAPRPPLRRAAVLRVLIAEDAGDAGRVRAVLPQLLDVPAASPASTSKTCSSRPSTAAGGTARRCWRRWRSWPSSAAAAGSSGRCSTGTRRRSRSTSSLGAKPMDEWTVIRVTERSSRNWPARRVGQAALRRADPPPGAEARSGGVAAVRWVGRGECRRLTRPYESRGNVIVPSWIADATSTPSRPRLPAAPRPSQPRTPPPDHNSTSGTSPAPRGTRRACPAPRPRRRGRGSARSPAGCRFRARVVIESKASASVSPHARQLPSSRPARKSMESVTRSPPRCRGAWQPDRPRSWFQSRRRTTSHPPRGARTRRTGRGDRRPPRRASRVSPAVAGPRR